MKRRIETEAVAAVARDDDRIEDTGEREHKVGSSRLDTVCPNIYG